jgi:hypothetical protein
MQAALVREGTFADPGLTLEGLDVRKLVDRARNARELLQLVRRDAVVAKLELKIRDDRTEIGVAAALTDAVDRALDLCCAGLNGRD